MTDKAYLGGGCFWCLDALYRRLKGVKRVTSGYAGGEQDNPSYEQVSGGGTGHAEVVEVEFDPKLISYDKLLEIFWHIHDPTTPNRQGFDVGPQYRSVILYADSGQKTAAKKSLNKTAKPLWGDGVVTELKALQAFWPAEDYHQDYFNKNPEAGYCQAVINPKLAKFNKEFAALLKPA